MKTVFISFLLVSMWSLGFSQSKSTKDFSRYVQIPSLNMQDYQKMDMPTQAKYDRRKNELRNKINEVYKLNKDKLYDKDQKSFNNIITSIESYFQNLPSEYADLSKDFRYRQIISKMDVFEKSINEKAAGKTVITGNNAPSSSNGIPKSFKATDVVQWEKELGFVPKYETTTAFQLETMSLSAKNIRDLIKNAKKIDKDAAQKKGMINEMVGFWDGNISADQISQHFFKYFTFYNIDKGYYIKHNMKGKKFKTYPSKK